MSDDEDPPAPAADQPLGNPPAPAQGPPPGDPLAPEDGQTSGEGLPALRRLDPDRARPAAGDPALGAPAPDGAPTSWTRSATSVAVDTRRYRMAIGIFGLILVVVVSIYQFAANGVATTGIPPGHRLRWFAAPLASTNLIGDANLRPPCTASRHDRRALNICLISASHPLVLSLFVLGSGACENQVDALQTLSRRYPSLRFAAVAINGSRADTAAAIRSHRWTIPVAYDRDGGVGSVYGVAVCPMAELALRGGIVRDELIGDNWQTVAELEPRIAALARASTG
ncbi:MAG TPA: hypothetical protein VFN55_17775 [Solirubrobacteraceae bacterium]|nr:hypothetical protein [Solirubrobacteraceae bacterium]